MEAIKTPLNSTLIVEEELKRIPAPYLHREIQRLATAVTVLGGVEIAAGLLAIALPFITAAFFVVLLGMAILISGIAQLVNAAAHASWGRGITGSVSVLAGLLTIAHPLFGLSFLILVLGIYLIASGVARLFSADATGWDIAGGVLGILLGGMVLSGWPSTGFVTLGIVVGVSLLFGGSGAVSLGRRLRRSFMTQPSIQ